jgi:transcriptional regulator with XRE-family HTH domain
MQAVTWITSPMPPRDRIDRPTRERLKAWIRYAMKEYKVNQRELAKKIGVNESTISRALAGGPIGLDLVIGLHRGAHLSANSLLDADPD